MSNKALLIIFVIGLVTFIGIKWFEPDTSQSFDPVLVRADTLHVDKISFISPEGKFDLIRQDTAWFAKMEDRSVPARKSTVHSILYPLAHLEAKRIVTSQQERHAEYEVSDSMATRLELYENGKRTAEILIGGFYFDQTTRSANGYARLPGRNEVYLIDGFTAISLKPTFDVFRERKLMNLKADDLAAIEWKDQSGGKRTISKENGQWYYAGMEAVDSTSFHNYLMRLVNVQGKEFIEADTVRIASPHQIVTLYSFKATDPVVIEAYYNDDPSKPFIIHSSGNPQAWFASDSSGIYHTIFEDLHQFWPDGQ